ncbi:hypothetical protein QR680_016709 [Steinernema hermaphroditum]|uniref:Uncharacterized protein n=1 Tax=Steinernema hermaphroditum TaxID=289476 RepID=A0AA39LMW2_9BILA|nr:hypothetical protein QR680_016709 [Steinernema hermaphroditum]
MPGNAIRAEVVGRVAAPKPLLGASTSPLTPLAVFVFEKLLQMSRNLLSYVFLCLLVASPCWSIRGALFRSGRSPTTARLPAIAADNEERVPEGPELIALLQSDDQFPAAFGNLHPSSTRALFRRIQALYGQNGATALLN